MNGQEMGASPASRSAARSDTPAPRKPQRARILARTYWRCLARVSSASCCSRALGPDMREKMGGVRGAGQSLHPEQVAGLEEKPVRRPGQIPEPEGVGFRERGAVAEEAYRPGQRLVGEQDVVAEVVARDGACRGPGDQQR